MAKAGVDYVGVGIGVMVRNEKGEFLLGQRQKHSNNEPGKWCFPGGTLEFGEKLFNCVKREAKEEAGSDVEPLRLVKVIDHILPDEKQHWFNPVVEARLLSGKPIVTEPNKMTQWQWFSLDNLPENLTANMVKFFKGVKEGKIRLD